VSDSDDKTVECELREREELTRRLIEAMPGGVVHIRIDGSIERANPEALRVLGLRLDELTQRYVSDFAPETIWEDGSPCTAEEYPATRALVTGERQPPATIGVKRPDGEISWAVFTAVPVTDPDSGAVTGAVVTFLDITDRKRAEAEREELQSRLVLADRMASIGTLAAGVAHEINNPLTYVLTNLQLLETQLLQLGADVTSRLSTRLRDAREGLDRVRNVVRDLSAFSHEDTSTGAVDVHAVLESSLRMAANELRYRARVVRSYGEVPPALGNPSRLGQVFLNLLVNASQAIDAGCVEDNAITVTTSTSDDGQVVVEISDTGAGIPDEVIGRIFDPFVTTKDAGLGTGLGLYICHNIVTGLGGTISVSSELGRGTTFEVALPAGDGSRVLVPVGSDPALPIPRETSARLRILVIDDEPGILKLFERALEGHRVTLATSGRQALYELEEREFDVIFCDLIMPDVTGMDVFENAIARRPELATRFVFMTGGAFTERSRRFVDALPDRILRKPFGDPELLEIVASRADD
jgi:PAS domain S-box-containing protein